MLCEKILLRWAWNGCEVSWEIRDGIFDKKEQKKQTSKTLMVFRIVFLFTQSDEKTFFTEILKLSNIHVPFKLRVNTALEKCLGKIFG